MDNSKEQAHLIVPQMAPCRGSVNKRSNRQSRPAGSEIPADAAETLGDNILGTSAWHAEALDIARGTSRYLRALGYAVAAELPLADGRRADLMALDPRGGIAIIEVKSCLADFRADQKWEDYRQWCDLFYFAVDAAFPRDCIPEECGLIIADRYGAEALREPPEHRLSASRRKAVTLRFARCAAFRLHGADDPDIW
jgi:hypothetical protein